LVLVFLEAEGDKKSATKLIATDAGWGGRIAGLKAAAKVIGAPIITVPDGSGTGLR
jgi:hypothetical protein